MNYLKEIFFILGSEKKSLPLVILIILLGSFLDLLSLSIIAPFIILISEPETVYIKYGDNFLFSKFVNYFNEVNLILVFGILLIIVFVFRSVLSIYLKYWILKYTLKLRVKIQSKLLKSYQELPYVEYTSKNNSYYIESITSLVANFTSNISAILNSISDFVIMTFIWVYLLFMNFKITLIITFILITSIFIYDLIFRVRLRTYGQSRSEGSKKMIQSLMELINGFKEIKIFNLDIFFQKKILKGANTIADNLIKSGAISSAPRYFFESLIVTCFVTYSIFFNYFNFSSTENFIAQMSVFGFAALKIIPAANQFTSNFVTLRFGRFATSRLYQDMTSEDMHKLEKQFSNKEIISKNFDFKKLEIKNLTFKYPSRQKNVINNISLKIEKGQLIGIKGRSGVGKTTLVDLIIGFLKPNSGEILINEEPLENSKNLWRSKIAYIPQQTLLIDDTIKKNIALGKNEEDINDSKLKESLEKSNLSIFVNSLQKGIETIIGEKGVQLSGGQKQRIALARAFYYDREVFILDEVTNSLDKTTEIEILSQIELLKKDKTIIIISHDINNLKICDEVFEL